MELLEHHPRNQATPPLLAAPARARMDALPPTVFVSVTDALYLLCSFLLLGSAVVVLFRNPGSPLHRRFALTAVSLLGWVSTLALYYRSDDPAYVLWLGRVNFAAAALAVASGYFLVRALARDGEGHDGKNRTAGGALPVILTVEAALLTLLSAVTPLIDRAELTGADTGGGRHITVYGVLFPLYAVHVVGYLAAAALTAFSARRSEDRGAVRDRLTLVGAGVVATGVVGVVADIVLPYGFGDFRLTDLGPLSTALFLLSVGYAVLKHRLFDLRVLIRKTVVMGVLGSLALSVYGALLAVATDKFAGEGSGTITRFGILMIVLSFDPLRRVMEHRIDQLLFQETVTPRTPGSKIRK